jgi:hypothetical protein
VSARTGPERFDTVIVGGGQAGLATGYHLARLGRPFVILDAGRRVGDPWRARWDSLRLYTPARYSGLPGWGFPAADWHYPTRVEVADYLEAYATRFELPVRNGVRVDGLTQSGDRYLVTAGERRFEADNVVVAAGAYAQPRVPEFAPELGPDILQLHSSRYLRPDQLRQGGVLVVGAAISGAEIAVEVAGAHPTWLSGRHPGSEPTRAGSRLDRLLTPPFWFFISRVLSVDTPVGRKLRPKLMGAGTPWPGSSTGTSPPPGSSGSQGPSGPATASPCWRTVGRWRWPTSSGAPATAPTSPGSTCRSSTPRASRGTTAAWSPPSPGSTSSGCSSSPRSPRPWSAGSAPTPSASPRRSPPTSGPPRRRSG